MTGKASACDTLILLPRVDRHWRQHWVTSCCGLLGNLAATWPYHPNTHSAIAAELRHSPHALIVAVVHTDDDSQNMICRQFLRPLIESGFAAVCLTESTFST